MQRTALYALDPELPSKLGLRSFRGMKGTIRDNSALNHWQGAYRIPGKKGETHPVPLFLYGTIQNVPWVIPIRLFTCKFKYGCTCTDKTLPRSFLTHLLLTSTSRVFDPRHFRIRQKLDGGMLKAKNHQKPDEMKIKKFSVFVFLNVSFILLSCTSSIS